MKMPFEWDAIETHGSARDEAVSPPHVARPSPHQTHRSPPNPNLTHLGRDIFVAAEVVDLGLAAERQPRLKGMHIATVVDGTDRLPVKVVAGEELTLNAGTAKCEASVTFLFNSLAPTSRL